MENKPKSLWAKLLGSLDQFGAALAYEPEDELFSRVARLEKEVQALRYGAGKSSADAAPKYMPIKFNGLNDT